MTLLLIVGAAVIVGGVLAIIAGAFVRARSERQYLRVADIQARLAVEHAAADERDERLAGSADLADETVA
ncbi:MULTISPECIES: hypothetical protein [unclassified Nocardia]|uniref:hypothetical protein n=1 Tax=unclassified Nocardia TaxID=2637762 RepID=UPI001CE45D83|nr:MULTISPECIES: hypothetical protein [unclassified Nocardia]